jgi:two-component system sensor histidine kinase/response regulator
VNINPELVSAREEGGRPTTILLVDDDDAILDGTSDLLRLYGYNVITAVNGRQALDMMETCLPDLVVADIMMPDMNGYELFEAVRQRQEWAAIPFIFLSALGQQSDVRRGIKLGADAYVTKPFEPEDLLIAIQARLKRVHEIQSATQADVERMKQQLITIFGHELRTPLSYIYGYVNLLQEQHHELDEQSLEEMLNGVQRGAERLVRLIEDLMLLVRLDSGLLEMEIGVRQGPAQVRPIVWEVFGKLKQAAEERNVTLENRVSEDLIVWCMPNYLAEALLRLVDNAIKFSKRGEPGHVLVDAFTQDDQAVIRVHDQGIGIAPSQFEQIFDRFHQVDRQKMEQQGAGLGLTIARGLIRLHGGNISVQSELGKGSIFSIHLPLNSHHPPEGS